MKVEAESNTKILFQFRTIHQHVLFHETITIFNTGLIQYKGKQRWNESVITREVGPISGLVKKIENLIDEVSPEIKGYYDKISNACIWDGTDEYFVIGDFRMEVHCLSSFSSEEKVREFCSWLEENNTPPDSYDFIDAWQSYGMYKIYRRFCSLLKKELVAWTAIHPEDPRDVKVR